MTRERAPSGIPTAAHADMLLALLLTACFFLLVHGYALGRPFVVNDDTRQQLFWMQRWLEPGLYPEPEGQGWLAEYARHYVTPGVRGLYRVAGAFLDPFSFSKVLAGVEFVLLGGVLFVLGRRLGRLEEGAEGAMAGSGAGWSTLCVYWMSPFFLHGMAGGLARSFAAPLLALFCLAWLRGSALGVLLCLALLSLFIPYVYALCAVALAVGWLGWRARLLPPPPAPAKMWHYLACVLTVVPAWLYNQELGASGFGPMADIATMQDDPVFGPLGRFPILPVPSLFFELVARPWERIIPFRELGVLAGAGCAVLLGLVLFKGARRLRWKRLRPVAPLALSLAAASLLLYAVARIWLLTLFIPSRYLEYTTNLFYCILTGVLLWAAPRQLSRRAGKRGGAWMARSVIVGCLLLGAFRLHGIGLHDYSDGAELYAALRRTPQDSLLAGHPYTMDNALSFGRRNVLASYELAHPWSMGVWTRSRPALEDGLRALYAKDAAVVREFAVRYGVDYMVVDERTLEQRFTLGRRRLAPLCEAPMPDWARGPCRKSGLDITVLVRESRAPGFPSDHPLFEPYGELIRELAAQPGEFVLLDETEFPCQRLGEHYRLIPLSDQGQGG